MFEPLRTGLLAATWKYFATIHNSVHGQKTARFFSIFEWGSPLFVDFVCGSRHGLWQLLLPAEFATQSRQISYLAANWRTSLEGWRVEVVLTPVIFIHFAVEPLFRFFDLTELFDFYFLSVFQHFRQNFTFGFHELLSKSLGEPPRVTIHD